MKKGLSVLPVLLSWFLCVGTTYYVAPTGSDSNPGTSAQPWLTPQKAADEAVAGDIVVIKYGSYAPFEMPNSGTSNAWITFEVNPGYLVQGRAWGGTNIYVSYTYNPKPSALWHNGVLMTEVATSAELNQEGEWWYQANYDQYGGRIRIYTMTPSDRFYAGSGTATIDATGEDSALRVVQVDYIRFWGPFTFLSGTNGVVIGTTSETAGPNTNYIELVGFSAKEALERGVSINNSVANPTDNTRLAHCEVSDVLPSDPNSQNGHGIKLASNVSTVVSTGTIIEDCLVHDNWGIGIQAGVGHTSPIIRRNEVYNNSLKGVGAVSGIRLNTPSALVYENEVYGSNQIGIDISPGSTNSVIERNMIRNNRYGIYFPTANNGGIKVINNEVRGNSLSGISGSPTAVSFYNNTVSGNGYHAVSLGGSNHVLKNNIFRAAGNHAMNVPTGSTTDYNLFYQTSGSPSNALIRYAGTP